MVEVKENKVYINGKVLKTQLNYKEDYKRGKSKGLENMWFDSLLKFGYEIGGLDNENLMFTDGSQVTIEETEDFFIVVAAT